MNVSRCQDLSGLLQVRQMNLNEEQYLGLPFFIGRRKKVPFSTLVDKMGSKLERWRSVNMSQPGRTVMVKNVLNFIPVHHMTSFRLPDVTIRKMNYVQHAFWRKKETNSGLHYTSWDNLCKPKNEGGLGFRDLQCFNRALLAKSAWKLCTDGDSIWRKSLEAKYFPDGDPINLQVKKSNTTWSWSSIGGEMEFIKKYSCWSIGNGRKILIWKHRWIPDFPGTLLPKASVSNWSEFSYLHQLFIPNSNLWNVTIIQHLFDPPVANIILNMTIHPSYEDKLIWLLEKNGRFTVKSAYRQLYNDAHANRQANLQMQNVYKKLWSFKLLPRIKHHIWKCLTGILATRDKIVKVLHHIDATCPFCNAQVETDSHVLMQCTIARAVWFSMIGYHVHHTDNVKDWILTWFDSLHGREITQEEFNKRATIIWCLWTERCMKAFQNTDSTPDKVIIKCTQYIHDQSTFSSSPPVSLNRQMRDNLHWSPPPFGSYTFNSDGSYKKETNSGGLGLIIRDFAGSHRGSKCIHLASCWGAEQAECLGLWEAAKWAKELKMEHVFFELDALLVVNAVNTCNYAIDWRLQNIIMDIKSLFSEFSSWKCVYIPKEKNKIADTLSKLARVDKLSRVWNSNPPNSICRQLLEEEHLVNS